MSSIKIIIASQACHINLYKNLKSKISKCRTSIYFNLDVVLDGSIIYKLLLVSTQRDVLYKKMHCYFFLRLYLHI